MVLEAQACLDWRSWDMRPKQPIQPFEPQLDAGPSFRLGRSWNEIIGGDSLDLRHLFLFLFLRISGPSHEERIP